ncbi:hypothetical protein [Streptomyces sp. MS1.AVA.4]|uniref:Uncharacterized protein n=1 Tax=Streptomyces pratisoli TaxID=3139917 RepID=A0ACC6QV33_9ACTN
MGAVLTARVDYEIHITDAILNGLPPHIAQVIAGHTSISTTMGYAAIYPADAIEAHRAFIARRRSLRSTEELRELDDRLPAVLVPVAVRAM